MRKVATLLAILLALAGLFRIAATEIVGEDATTRASDALPLYLYGAAAADGLDPTLAASLGAAYDDRKMSVGAAIFSTLYPATAGSLLRPAAAFEWERFTTIWRWLLLASLGSFGVSAAVFAAGDRWTRARWGALAAALLAWHPVSAECVRLGQVNMLLGALCFAAIAASTRGGGAVPGALLAVGALLKLVPGALLVPLLLTRRWPAVASFAAVGLIGVALTVPGVPLPRILVGIAETLRFQSSIDPDWLVGRERAPEWMRVLGFIRHDGLQWVTLGAAALVPFARPSRDTAAGAMALLCAWLGADAAGFHVLYAPLVYPALLWVGIGRPWRFMALGGLFHLLTVAPAIAPEPRMVLFGLLAWAFCAVGLLEAAARVEPGPLEADRELRQGGLALLGVAAGAILMGSLPGDGPVAPPLPEGQTTPDGAGFIHRGDRVPGEITALGAGLDRPASTLARPGTIRDLQRYLRGAPALWRALGGSYPARAALFEARASAAPRGELRDHSGRTIATWLGEEQAAIAALRTEGIDVGELGARLDAALASGLTDPDLSGRIPMAPIPGAPP